MKMSILFSGVFWGVFLILVGSSLILKVVFHVDIPVFRVFFGLLLIFLGIKVLAGWEHSGRGDHETLFGDTRVSGLHPGKKVDVVFGRGVIDLREVSWNAKQAQEVKMESSTVFGQTVVKLNPKIPTEIRASAAFSGAEFPDDSTIAFGEYVYRNKAFKAGKPALVLKVSVVFGSLEVQ